jgi:hypothetical protein
MDTGESHDDPFAHLKRRANERAERTVERLRAGIAALQATGEKVTAESLKQITRQRPASWPKLQFVKATGSPCGEVSSRSPASALLMASDSRRTSLAMVRSRRALTAAARSRNAMPEAQVQSTSCSAISHLPNVDCEIVCETGCESNDSALSPHGPI